MILSQPAMHKREASESPTSRIHKSRIRDVVYPNSCTTSASNRSAVNGRARIRRRGVSDVRPDSSFTIKIASKCGKTLTAASSASATMRRIGFTCATASTQSTTLVASIARRSVLSRRHSRTYWRRSNSLATTSTARSDCSPAPSLAGAARSASSSATSNRTRDDGVCTSVG